MRCGASLALAGEMAGRVTSLSLALSLVSAASAMTFAGPRVLSAMARDGFLPSPFAGRGNAPPRLSTFLQTAIAIVIVFSQSLKDMLEAVGAVVVLFSGLTALCVFYLPRPRAPIRTHHRVAAGVYVVTSSAIVACALQRLGTVAIGLAVLLIAAAAAYRAARGPRSANLLSSHPNRNPHIPRRPTSVSAISTRGQVRSTSDSVRCDDSAALEIRRAHATSPSVILRIGDRAPSGSSAIRAGRATSTFLP